MFDDPSQEVSAFFASPERWAQHLTQLQDPQSGLQHLRLYHHGPQHLAQVLDALSGSSSGAGGHSSLTSLDVQSLEVDGALRLGALLASPVALPHLHTLRLPELCAAPSAAIVALTAGLAANVGVRALDLSGLTAEGVKALAVALVGRQDRLGEPLYSLRLERCRLSSEGAAAALGAALGAVGVQRLQIVSSELGDAELTTLLQSGGSSLAKGLVELDLSSNFVCHAGAHAIASLLNHGRLTHLHLPRNRLRNDGVAALLATDSFAAAAASHADASAKASACTATCAISHLHTLDVSFNGITAPGALSLAATLATPACALVRLDLDGNALGAGGFTAILTAALRHGVSSAGTALRELHAEDCDAGLAAVAAAAATSATVTGQHDAGDARGLSLAPANACRLEGLWLARNRMGDSGVTALRAMLAPANGEQGALTHLDLSDNCIGDAGVEGAVVPLLLEHPRLGTLLLEANRVRDVAAKRLVVAALAHPALHTFRAESKRVTDAYVRAALLDATHVLAGRHVMSRRHSGGGASSHVGSVNNSGRSSCSRDSLHMAAAVMLQRQDAGGCVTSAQRDGGGTADGTAVEVSGPGVLRHVSSNKMQRVEYGAAGSFAADGVEDWRGACHRSEGSDAGCSSDGSSAMSSGASLSLHPHGSASTTTPQPPQHSATSPPAVSPTAGPCGPQPQRLAGATASPFGVKRRRFKPLTAEEQQQFSDF